MERLKKITKAAKAIGYVAKNSEIVQRYKSPTPTHFKRSGKIGLIIAGAGLALKIMAVFIAPPVGLVALAPEMIALGCGIAGISYSAKK